MAKYNDDFKLMIVKEYLEGPLGYILLARKYDIPSETPIKRWVNSYKAFGEEGLRRSMSRKATCADNAAMENFLGVMKQEMYYGEELISYDELKQKMEKFITTITYELKQNWLV